MVYSSVSVSPGAPLMDVIIPNADLNYCEDVEHAYVNHKGYTDNAGEDDLVAEIGLTLDVVLHIEDVQVPVLASVAPSDTGEIYDPEEKICEEVKLQQANSTATTQNCLRKCATFPFSKNKISRAASSEVGDDITGTALHEESTVQSRISPCGRSISMPINLLSAIKGSREKEGIPQKKMTVTWAPDVYDPPTTSMSHTVKGHNQHRYRSSSKKNGKHNKHKSTKSSRSASSSSSDKKQHRRISGYTDSRLKSPPVPRNRYVLSSLSQSSVEDLSDFSVTGQDSKCGSSFLRESLPKLHISVAEAT